MQKAEEVKLEALRQKHEEHKQNEKDKQLAKRYHMASYNISYRLSIRVPNIEDVLTVMQMGRRTYSIAHMLFNALIPGEKKSTAQSHVEDEKLFLNSASTLSHSMACKGCLN